MQETQTPALDAVIGLGANLGDARGQLRAAVASLASSEALLRVSALYATQPVGPPQPDFLNAAVRLSSARSPEALLDRLRELEAAAGRVRRERWGPRTLDLDLLWIQGASVASERLQVPHPRLAERPFALLPLLDVAPEAVDPRTGTTYAVVAAALGNAGVRRLPGGSTWSGIA